MQKSSRIPETSPVILLEHERNYRQHLNRMIDISSAKGPFAVKQRNIYEHDAMLQRRQEYSRRQKSLHLNEIEKSNYKLLTRLMEINIGKSKSTSKSQPKTQAPVNENDKNLLKEHSLHGFNQEINRKKEVLRILNENTKVSERLVLKESNFSLEKMSREYQQNREYSNIARRIRIRSDKTLELGQGSVKFSKDLRIASHNSYLPPLHPISTNNYRASSVSRLPADNRANSCRSIGKVTQVPKTARQRVQTLNTEPDTFIDSSRALERCYTSPSFKPVLQLSETTITDTTVHVKKEDKEEKEQSQSLLKYGKGGYLIQNTTYQDNIVKALEKEKIQEDGSLIQEESQTKEESIQQSYLKNFDSKQTSEGLVKKDTKNSNSDKNTKCELETEEYEEIFDSESISKKTSEKEINNGDLNSKEIEEYIEDFASLSESQKEQR